MSASENAQTGVDGRRSRAPEQAPATRRAAGSSGATYPGDDLGIASDAAARRIRFAAAYPHIARRLLGKPPIMLASKTHTITVDIRGGKRTVSTAVEGNPFGASRPPVRVLPKPRPSRDGQASKIVEAVARAFEVGSGEMYAPQRGRRVAFPRFAAYRLISKTVGWSTTQIGKHFYRDHTTIIAGLRRAEWLLSRDRDWQARYEAAVAEMKGVEQ